jgi:hypothetical protein
MIQQSIPMSKVRHQYGLTHEYFLKFESETKRQEGLKWNSGKTKFHAQQEIFFPYVLELDRADTPESLCITKGVLFIASFLALCAKEGILADVMEQVENQSMDLNSMMNLLVFAYSMMNLVS